MCGSMMGYVGGAHIGYRIGVELLGERFEDPIIGLNFIGYLGAQAGSNVGAFAGTLVGIGADHVYRYPFLI